MPVDLNVITGLDGADNMGGFKSRILFYPANQFSAAPLLPAVIAANADFVTAAGAFVPKVVGTKPTVFECTDGTVKYSAPTQGELEGQSFAPAGEFYRAGSKVEYGAFARKYNNTPGYVVLEDMDGKQILVGQPGLLCHLKAEYDGGQKRSDRRGMKFTFSADSIAPIIYLGTPIDVDALLEA